MDLQGIIGRFGRRLLWCMLGAMLALAPGAASAASDACGDGTFTIKCQPIPNCQNQVQAPITFNIWQTQGLNYYCVGDHPYFYTSCGAWSLDSTDGWSYTENPIIEVTGSLFSGTFTNWNFSQQQLVVTLACSDTPQD